MDKNHKTSPKQQFWLGVRVTLPIVSGVLPFGLIFGVLVADAGIHPLLAWSTSSLIFAGSAQFLAVPLFAEGASFIVLVFTTFIINLRHLLYSASMAPHAQNLSRGWQVILSYLLTDEAYVPTILHYEDKRVASTHKHWFWLGAGLTLWTTWQTFTGLGIFVGEQLLPEGLGLEFTLALTFIGMIVPQLVSWPPVASALSAGVVAVLAYPLPYRLNLMLAAAVGIAVGLWLERRQPAVPVLQATEEL